MRLRREETSVAERWERRAFGASGAVDVAVQVDGLRPEDVDVDAPSARMR